MGRFSLFVLSASSYANVLELKRLLNEYRRKFNLLTKRVTNSTVTLGSFSNDYGDGNENGKK